jgi:hypothetical protein
MKWVLRRPGLVALEVAWKWAFGIPLLLVCQDQALHVQRLVSADPAPPGFIDFDNPWMAAQQLAVAWAVYRPYVQQVLSWLIPTAAMAWVVASGVGRSLLLVQMEPQLKMRAAASTALQAIQATVLGLALWGWYASLSWAAAAHISTAGEPDLVGYSMWAIFLSLGFFVLWALVSWPLGIAPVVMFLEDCSPWQALQRSFRLGKVFTGNLVEINLVMGIALLALAVLAMVLSAALLPFSDQLGPQVMHVMWGAAAIFFLVASDFFQVMRLKSFVEFWWIFRG